MLQIFRLPEFISCKLLEVHQTSVLHTVAKFIFTNKLKSIKIHKPQSHPVREKDIFRVKLTNPKVEN